MFFMFFFSVPTEKKQPKKRARYRSHLRLKGLTQRLKPPLLWRGSGVGFPSATFHTLLSLKNGGTRTGACHKRASAT